MKNSEGKFLSTLKALEIFIEISVQKEFQLLFYTVDGEYVTVLL